MLRSSDHITKLAEHFSPKHPNIRFTYELEIENTLPFLDVNVFRDADKFSTTIHRKSTFSGVYSNFRSFMPDTYKRGLVSTLLYRAYMIYARRSSLFMMRLKNLRSSFRRTDILANLLTNVSTNFSINCT